MATLVLGGSPPTVSPPLGERQGYRHLLPQEVAVLESRRNYSDDPNWANILVKEGHFDPTLITESSFSGYIVLGAIERGTLRHHDLEVPCGIFRSDLKDVVLGDYCSVRNVSYLRRYNIGTRVILFNIQELSCTNHSKFGEGILKDGESESDRVWIGVANENGGRSILAHRDMIAADAWIYSKYRDDTALMDAFKRITEAGRDTSLDTVGVIENDAIIKNTTLLKDAYIGASAYIKGAFKLKNVTILSSPDEVSQIGEGVELVNGIMGYGSRVFYQAVAVRFIIGRNCQLKYGARLLNSVLGDNSTVSCCEILNNLIFPFHEQHHNSSFLIASVIQGQSNIASGATIGSNHNSRSPDGEIVAHRGFWSGLNTSFKHNSYFASFVLVAKGSYCNELNVRYPFSLVAPCICDNTVHIIPAYWFLYNMFAIARNSDKFTRRDKRVCPVQHIETSPFAPDTMEEVIWALGRLIELTAVYLDTATEDDEALYAKKNGDAALGILREYRARIKDSENRYQVAKDFLHHCNGAHFKVADSLAQRKYPAIVYKVGEAYREYRRVLKYYSAHSLIDYLKADSTHTLASLKSAPLYTEETVILPKGESHSPESPNGSPLSEALGHLKSTPLYTEWENIGGQIVPHSNVVDLCARIKSRAIGTYNDIHSVYDQWERDYPILRARHAIYALEWLYSRPIEDFTRDTWQDMTCDVLAVSEHIYSCALEARQKDFSSPFRQTTYRNKAEMEAVLGPIDSIGDNGFLAELGRKTALFKRDLLAMFQ